MSDATEQEQEQEISYDSDDPTTWRRVQSTVAKREAAAVEMDALGELTPSQISNIKEIRRRATEGRHDSFRLTTFRVALWAGGKAFVHIRGTRTDCDEYSPRAVLSAVEGRFLLGKRGGVEVMTNGLRESTTQAELTRHPFIYGFRHGI